MTNEDFMDMYDDYLMHGTKYANSPSYKTNRKEYNAWYYENVTKPKESRAYGGRYERPSSDLTKTRAAIAARNARINARRQSQANAESEMARINAASGRRRPSITLNRLASNAQTEAARGRRRSALTRNSSANVSNEERRSRYKTNMRKRKFTAGVNRIKSRGNKIAQQLKNQWNSHLDNYNVGMDELSNMIKRAKTSRKKRK